MTELITIHNKECRGQVQEIIGNCFKI